MPRQDFASVLWKSHGNSPPDCIDTALLREMVRNPVEPARLNLTFRRRTGETPAREGAVNNPRNSWKTPHRWHGQRLASENSPEPLRAHEAQLHLSMKESRGTGEIPAREGTVNGPGKSWKSLPRRQRRHLTRGLEGPKIRRERTARPIFRRGSRAGPTKPLPSVSYLTIALVPGHKCPYTVQWQPLPDG